VRCCFCIMPNASDSPNDKIEAAESIITLLARLNVSKFPWEERIGLAVAQMRAMRQWTEAIRSARGCLRYQRLFHRDASERPEVPNSVRTPLSSFLVDRGHPERQ
jgi:hypothetical protein